MLCLCFSYIQKLQLHEREKREQAETAWRKLLQKCRILFNQLQECNLNLPYKDEDRTFMNSSSLSDAFDQLTVSDDQTDILLAEVHVICFLWHSIFLPSCKYFVLNTTHLERLSSLLQTRL